VGRLQGATHEGGEGVRRPQSVEEEHGDEQGHGLGLLDGLEKGLRVVEGEDDELVTLGEQVKKAVKRARVGVGVGVSGQWSVGRVRVRGRVRGRGRVRRRVRVTHLGEQLRVADARGSVKGQLSKARLKRVSSRRRPAWGPDCSPSLGFEPCTACLVMAQLDDLLHLGQQISNLPRLLEDRLWQDDCEEVLVLCSQRACVASGSGAVVRVRVRVRMRVRMRARMGVG